MVSRAFATRAHLPRAKNVMLSGKVFQEAKTRAWRVGSIALIPQDVAVLKELIPVAGPIDGIIAGDVLSRFSAVRFDFAHQAITLLGAESGYSLLQGGGKGGTLPRSWRSEDPLDATAVTFENDFRLYVDVSIEGFPAIPMLVDTGSQICLIPDKAAARLPVYDATQSSAEILSLSGVRSAREYRITSWSLVTHQQPFGAYTIDPALVLDGEVSAKTGAGILGATVLAATKSIVLDYAAREFWW